MKLRIAILGSTGSIGKSTIKIIRNHKIKFDLKFITTNKNIALILKQANEFKVKNIVIYNKKKFYYASNDKKFKHLNIYNNLSVISKKFDKKIDYTMCSISGLDGLAPTLEAIKFSKKVAIANKESIICGWNIIKKKLNIYKTKFIPVDSEHFSIHSLLNETKNDLVDEIYITASGGPFLKLKKSKFKKINLAMATKHPNWKMGKKISIDSATMMNKVFEVVEAQRIFSIDLYKFKILIHPKSYVHAIIKFKNGLSKILIHDTDMMIPIFNSIFNNKINYSYNKKLDIDSINNLNLQKVDYDRFPAVKILKKITPKNSLYDTVIISANDELVDLFIQKKITFLDIHIILNKVINFKTFLQYKKIIPKSYKQILNLSQIVRLKTRSISIKYMNV